MAGRPAARSRGSKAATTSIHFRMPVQLRSRLRRFAEERTLGESEALRLAVSERLNQLDNDRELAAAERWQFEQAWASWERIKAGREKVVSADEMHRRIDRLLARKSKARGKQTA